MSESNTTPTPKLNQEAREALREVKMAGGKKKTKYSAYEEEWYKNLSRVIVAVLKEEDLDKVLTPRQVEVAELIADTMPLCRDPSLRSAAVKIMMLEERANSEDREKFPTPKLREWGAINAKLKSCAAALGLKDPVLTQVFGKTYKGDKGLKSWAQ